MKDLVHLEELETFAIASLRARSIASKYKTQTGIRRSSGGWEVLVPYSLRITLHSGSTRNYEEWEGHYHEDDFDANCEPDPRWSEDENLKMYKI